MVKVFNNPARTIIHVQGIISVISKHYEAFLPKDIVRKYSFRDFIRRDNIENQKRKFEIRGEYEIEAIKKVDYVFHRTEWDEAVIRDINPKINLHFAQEMMRETFYSDVWKYDECEKYSIFVSQGSYPIKGLHIMLEALKNVKEKYKEVKLYIAGDDILSVSSFKEKLREGYYSKYIRKLINRWGLTENIRFTGPLSEEQMKHRYLKSNVFVSASSIENSPNSVAEAMLLGMPIISSDVGGCSSILDNKQEGILYQADAPYMLAYYIGKIFEDKELSIKLGSNAALRAKTQYDRDLIVKDIINSYEAMLAE